MHFEQTALEKTAGTNPATFAATDTIKGFIGALKAPAKVDTEGTVTYTFKGWATSAEATTVIDTTSEELVTTLLEEGSTTLTLYAIYEEHSAATPAGITVTFMNGTNTFATATAVDGKVSLPETNPTLEAVDGYATTTYTFVGWVTADGTEFTANTTVEEDTTVYPKYDTGWVYGDVTGDKKILPIDRTYVHQFIANKKELGKTNKNVSAFLDKTVVGDVTGDGKILPIDRTYVHQFIANKKELGKTNTSIYVIYK